MAEREKADGVNVPNGDWRPTQHVCPADGEWWYGKADECQNGGHTKGDIPLTSVRGNISPAW
jgi:hypothetical protein